MIIGIDARPLGEEKPTGIAVFLKNILAEFDTMAVPNLEFILYSHKPINFRSDSIKYSSRIGSKILPGSVWIQTMLPCLLKKDNPDIYWGSFHVLPYRVPKQCIKIQDALRKLL